MNYDNLCKWIASALLVGAWLAIIILGYGNRPEAQSFILFIQSSIVALGAHGLTVSGTQPASPPAGEGSTSILPNGQPRPPLYVKGGVKLKMLLAIIVWAIFTGWIVGLPR